MENATTSTSLLLVQSLSDDVEPITFTAGRLAGRTFRAVLTEIQKAEVGRKYSRKDRRPLDPPPVAELRLFEITSSDNHRPLPGQIELLPDDDVSGDGIICQVDLFPLPEQGWTGAASQFDGHHINRLSSAAATPYVDPFEFFYLEEASSDSPSMYNPSTEGEHRAVAMYGDQAVAEGSKLVDAIAGTSAVHSNMIEFMNQQRILFVFPDMASRIEGRFFFRYRAYNILGTALSEMGMPIPVLAECYGQPFTVYSTNDFPGLHASTELTKVSNTHLPGRGCWAEYLEHVCLVDYSAFLMLGFESIVEIPSADGGKNLRQRCARRAVKRTMIRAAGYLG